MRIPSIIALCFAAVAVVETSAQTTENSLKVPEEKQTSLGLYLTPKEAFEIWKAEPGKVKVFDVRTPEEYIFVGHAEMAFNIPFLFQTYRWDEEKDRYALDPNPDFVAQVKELAELEDTILMMSRSGDRAAIAVNELAKAGFTNVYNIIDGMEGETVSDPESLYHGKRMKNGWKNSGLPWTYEVDRERAWVPKDKKP